MTIKAESILERGSNILEPRFVRHGFVYKKIGAGPSSGGHYAAGEFRKGTRRIEFHFRYSLGMVTYHLGAQSMFHQDYMRSILGRENASHYPGFSSDPLDGFHHLLQDLEEHCGEFLSGSDESFSNRIQDAQAKQSSSPGIPD
ncbi:MAG TPA: hypothetical protein VG225_04810 [Terracidiphilus sp.]|jgi:hypothetical protein|nr:hypothetical protein [Terracidiphilus sp.]